MNFLVNIAEPYSKNTIQDSLKSASNTIKFYNTFKESLLVSELPEELQLKFNPKKVIVLKKTNFPFMNKASTTDDFLKQNNLYISKNGRNSTKKLPEIKAVKTEENLKVNYRKQQKKLNDYRSPNKILDFSLLNSPSGEDLFIKNKQTLLGFNHTERLKEDLVDKNLNPQYSHFIKTLPLKSTSKPLHNFIKSLDINIKCKLKSSKKKDYSKFRNKSVNEQARLKFKIEDQFDSIEKEFKKTNQDLIKIVNEKNIDSKENTFEDNYEKDYLRDETKKLNREVFIYHKNNKEEKRKYFSIVKNNIFERSNHIERISCDGIYKFRDIIYDKFGKGFMQKHYS
jgi:hypothetical protein